MAQGILQALRAYRACHTDGDRIGSLFSRQYHVMGHGKPLLGIDARSNAPAIPVHKAGEVTVAQLTRRIPLRVRPRGGEH